MVAMKITSEISIELWEAIQRSYESGAWSNAILDAIYFVSDAIRAKTGLQSDGVSLVGQAFGGKSPKLRLNRLETESEQNIQSGVEHLFRGVYQAYRNPRSHGKVEDSQSDADAIIIFLGHLLKVIGHARAEFSLEVCVQRILDPNFVPNKRYAELLLAEIPQRQRLQVALTVYQQKKSDLGERLRYFFDAAVHVLTPEEQSEFFEAVSRDLRETADDVKICAALKCISPEHWLSIDEIARMRVEHRVIQSIQEGRHDAKRKSLAAGWLATWAPPFFRHFTLRNEVLAAIVAKLRSSSRTEQDYVFEYLFAELDALTSKPTPPLEMTVAAALEGGDGRFYNAVQTSFLWEDMLWGARMTAALNGFKSGDSVEEDDEVPF
jgi:uncharacterized protein (TIGR02391 family)